MKCYQCGKDIGESLGLCPACSEQRDQRMQQARDVHTVVSPAAQQGGRRKAGKIRDLSFQYYPYVILGLVVALALWRYLRVPDIETYVQNNSFHLVFDDHNELRYRMSGPVQFEGRVMYFSKGGLNSLYLGAAGVLHYLSAKDYEVYLQNVKGKKCPASFYNQHMRQLYLVPRTRDEAIQIRRATYREGESVYLTGHRLSYHGGKQDGKEYEFPPMGEREIFVRS